MGQSECTNWMRSTEVKEAVMRYAGEFKFAGGTVDAQDGGSLEATAKRELREEYELHDVAPEHIRLRAFNVKQTKPVRGRSYVMHNFVALASENPWLSDDRVTGQVNASLAAKRERFAAASAPGGQFWGTSGAERAALAPEVRCVEWLPLKRAAWMLLTSKAAHLTPVKILFFAP